MPDPTQFSQIFGNRYHVIFYATYGDFPMPCYFCGQTVDGHTHPFDEGAAVIHHIDHNRKNNQASNLAPAHNGCHKTYHRASPETRAKQSKAQLARWLRDGPPRHSEATKALLSQLKMGHEVSEEQRAKQSAAMTGRRLTPETRNKMSRAAAGKPKSDDHREKIRKHNQALDPGTVRLIRALATTGMSQAKIVEHLDLPVGQAQVSRILQGIVYQEPEYLPDETTLATTRAAVQNVPKQIHKGRRKLLSADQEQTIYTKYTSGEANQVALAAEYGVSQPYISTIVRRLAEENP